MVRKPVNPVNLLAELDEEPEEVQEEAVHREEPRKMPRESQEAEPQRKRHKTTAGRDPADKSSASPNDPSRHREGSDKGKDVAEGANIPKAPRPFNPRFHSNILKRDLTENDAVSSTPAVAYTLLKGISLPADVARMPKDRRTLAVDLMAKVAQVGQLTAAFCDAAAASDSDRRKELEAAKREIQSLQDKNKSLEDEGKLIGQRAEAAEKARSDAEAALAQAREGHQKEVERVDEEAFEAGKAAAVKELKPQVKGALNMGRTQGMQQGYALGYQQALTICEVPAGSKLWEVPPTPKYAVEKRVDEPKDGSSSKTSTTPAEDQPPPS